MSSLPDQIAELADEYARALSPEQHTYSSIDVDVATEAASDLLSDDELEAYAIVELDGAPWIFLVIGERGAALLRLSGEDRKRVAEARLLGPLRGQYRETLTVEDTGTGRRAVFEDERIPGGALVIVSPAPPAPRSFDSRPDERARIYFESLRPHLRRWASEQD